MHISVQERYDDISKISGLSEDIIRRVLKASRESLAKSLTKGDSATLPGICTITPEVKNRINIGGQSMTSYIKLKAKASNAMESELAKVKEFVKQDDLERQQNEEKEMLGRLNIVDSSDIKAYKTNAVRTTQISALL